MQKLFATIVFICSFAAVSTAQIADADKGRKYFQLNPLLREAFKKPVKTNPLLAERIKPSKYELMYWPNYPLTAAQIAARDRKNRQSLGGYIAEDIIRSVANDIIFGKKIPPAQLPKF
jgi:hypothetical protein